MAQERRADRTLLTAVERTLAVAGLLSPGAVLVVGVSGGPDSVCLLHLLTRLAPAHQLHLWVAHLDHGLRGKEGKEDARFVQAWAKSLGVPCIAERRSVHDYLAQHPEVSSLEEAARNVRYSFFTEVAERAATDAVAVGHTADDQVETVLLHLLRGAGLSGLSGMEEVSWWQSETTARPLRILRPLLAAARTETAQYCLRHKLESRFDASNASLSFTRNRLRLQVLPLLREINPQVDEAVLRLSSLVREEEQYVQEQVDTLWQAISTTTSARVAMDKKALLALPKTVQRRLIQRAYAQLTGSFRGQTYRHVQGVLALLNAAPEKRLRLSEQVEVVTSYNEIVFAKGVLATPAARDWPPVTLQVPGATVWGDWEVRCLLHPGAYVPQKRKPWEAHLDYAKIEQPLTVRSRRRGDRYQPLGMPSSQKLQDIFVNNRIPQSLRDTIPVLVTGERMVWVGGHRIADSARVRDGTQHTLEVVFTPRSEETQMLLRMWESVHYNTAAH